MDTGKPRYVAFGDDIPNAVRCIRFFAGYTDKLNGNSFPMRNGFDASVSYNPIGVIAQIVPKNGTVYLLASTWGPALATGILYSCIN